jgi:hypothetical protein
MSALTYEVSDPRSPVAVWLRSTFPNHRELQAEYRAAAGVACVLPARDVAPGTQGAAIDWWIRFLADPAPPGMPLADKVIEAIHRADAMVVLLTEAGAAAPFVQQEIGVARGARKLIVPIVQEGIDGNVLAMLAGVERIEVDFAKPSEALATVTSKLQPLVQSQAEKIAAAPAASPAAPNTMPVLVGLGLLVLALLIAFSDL